MFLGAQLGLYFVAKTMTIIPIRWKICRMLVRWCFPDNFLVSIFSIYLVFAVPHGGQSHISCHILFRSLIVVKVTMASPWRHDVGCEGESSEHVLYFRLVNYNIPAKWRWFFSLFINRTTDFLEITTFLVWMTIFGWCFTLHESFENGSKWTIAPKSGHFQIQKRPVVSKTVPEIKGCQNHMCHAWNLSDPMSGVTRPGKSQAFEVVSCRAYAGLNFLAWRVSAYIFNTYMRIYIYKGMSPAFRAMAWPHGVSTGVRPGLGSLAID